MSLLNKKTAFENHLIFPGALKEIPLEVIFACLKKNKNNNAKCENVSDTFNSGVDFKSFINNERPLFIDNGKSVGFCRIDLRISSASVVYKTGPAYIFNYTIEPINMVLDAASGFIYSMLLSILDYLKDSSMSGGIASSLDYSLVGYDYKDICVNVCPYNDGIKIFVGKKPTPVSLQNDCDNEWFEIMIDCSIDDLLENIDNGGGVNKIRQPTYCIVEYFGPSKV